MSETARTLLKPIEIRRRAYALMKQCWLTLLIAAVLMSLFTWIGSAVESHGEKLALEVYNAHMATFYAENEPPTTEAVAALDASRSAFLSGQEAPEWTDDIEYASLYETREWLAQYDAKDLYDAAFRPWEWLGHGIDLLDLLFSCIIAVGLCRGLLNVLRGEECTPHCLLSGWSRTSTACWMTIQTTLRILGWSLLPLIIFATISALFGGWASIVSSLLMMLVAIWASLHYALAEVHLADCPDRSFTASDCLRYAVDDADAFGIWQMCRVLWPLAIIFAADVAMMIAAIFVPALSIPFEIFTAANDLLFIFLRYTCYVCIYDEMRQRAIAAEAAVPANEGLARARALAAGKSAEE